MYRLQEPELLHDEEQEEAFGAGGAQEILPALQQAHGAQGDEVGQPRRGFLLPRLRCSYRGGMFTYVSSSIGRAAVSKTAGWGFESLLTCQRFVRIHCLTPGLPAAWSTL